MLHRGVQILGRLARQHGIAARQSYTRVSTCARREVAKLIHRGRHREAERLVRRTRAWPRRLARAVGRKVAGAGEAVRAAFATPLERIAHLLRQRRDGRGRGKVHALHAPEVECLVGTLWRFDEAPMGPKGKACTRFELDVMVSLAATNRLAPGGQFVIGARSLPGNPFNGHALAARITQTERITGVPVERAHVDRDYRSHNADKSRVFVSGRERGLTPTIRSQNRRRSGIEPVIGQMKKDGHLGRNPVAGAVGDAITVLLAAADPTFAFSVPG